MLTWETFVLLGMAIGWYKAAELENISSIPWVALSILFNLAALWLVGSIASMLVSQGLLMLLIAAWRAFGPGAR